MWNELPPDRPARKQQVGWALSWASTRWSCFKYGKVVPTKAVISGMAKELHSNVSLLTKLAAEIKP